jgi:calcineurin-like phosphoesterase family protein
VEIRNSTWIWSDTHFGHRNIIKFQQRPEGHETIMLSNWAERVHEEDTILHLGDVFLGSRGNTGRWTSILRYMPGRKYLILGNHDGYGREVYEEAGFTIIDPFIWKGVTFTHRPITKAFPGHPEDDVLGVRSANLLLDDWHTNIHGHIHGNTLETNHHQDDGDPLPNKKYVNVCVEVLDLGPRQVGSLIHGGL